MPAVPAFCDACGTVFESGFVVNDSFNVSFSGCKSGPCPKCSGTGHVPDGIFNFIGDTIQILSAPERTLKELTHLAEILRESQQQKASPDRVAARIKTELPGLARLGDLLPKNRAELYGFLAVVLAALQLMTQPSQSPPAPSVTINQIIQQTIVASPPPPQASRTPASPNRNDPCPCGSGKKYKKCCGKSR